MNSQEERPQVLLLSSNVRRRYAEDILTALALPRGATIQFRYEAQYVAPPLQQKVANGTIIGQRALIGFIADAVPPPNAVPPPDPFLLPIRVADIVAAECVAEVFLFKLRVTDHVDLDDYSLSRAEINTESRKAIDKIVEANGGTYYPAVLKFPAFPIRTNGDQAQLWISVARRLALHPTFENAYFMRVDQPVHLASAAAFTFEPEGRLSLGDLQPARLPVSFYAQRYTEIPKISLTCDTDGRFLRVSSDAAHDVALRYDSTEFWLQPDAASFDALTHVTIRLGPEQANTTPVAAVRFPVIIKHSRIRLISRLAISALGAILVATPAILGPASSLPLRIVLAVIGSAALSTATIVMGRPRS
ncbi:hypothetical protein [Streptomyces barringtoniae]|uniref:hypothetical protein n=1 Tax=Streptomyces barringtoniae TaxID=2892029 RepID=UPI001E3FB00B|nr:hypothetical protein [Streptomyces barringtoniae]MCC5480482.1 hypothetical protein [Streptomyces barringtoniae]